MAKERISSGSSFEAQIGYSRAVVEDGWVFVSGTTGYDYATMTLPDSVEEQCEQALKNIASALERSGCTLDDVVRVRYILSVREDFAPCWPLLRQAFGAARPAATLLVAGLLEPAMKIEIEVTAFRSSGG